VLSTAWPHELLDAERRFRQTLDRGAGARVFVGFEPLVLALGVLEGQRRDFVTEDPARDRALRLLLRFEGIPIRFAARNPVLASEQFHRLAHDQAADRTR